MKTLNSIKYILLALIVLGFFANFAQNEYGMDIVFFSLIGFIIVFLIEAILYRKKVEIVSNDFEKRNKKTIRIFIIILFCLITILIISGVITKVYNLGTNNIFGIINISAIFVIVAFGIFVLAFLCQKRKHFFESIFLILFCLALILKYLHLPGAPIIILFSATFLTILFFIHGISLYKTERKENKFLAFFVLCFFSIVAISILCNLFVIQHYPGSTFLSLFVFVLIFVISIPLIIQKKFIYKEQKITLWNKIRQIKGNSILLFMFYTLASIWWLSSKLEIAPKIYSMNNPPAFKKLIDEKDNKEEPFEIYRANLDVFWRHRDKFEQEKEGEK